PAATAPHTLSLHDALPILRRTVVAALKTQDFERSKAARFLHDSIGQNLTALGLQLDMVRMDLESVSPGIGARVAEIQHLLGGMIDRKSTRLNSSHVKISYA